MKAQKLALLPDMHQNGDMEYGSGKTFIVHMNILEHVNFQ